MKEIPAFGLGISRDPPFHPFGRPIREGFRRGDVLIPAVDLLEALGRERAVARYSSSNLRFRSSSISVRALAASAPSACTRILLPGPAANIIRPMMLLPLTV